MVSSITVAGTGTVFMLFPRKWKWPRHFPFGQISLQSHVTTHLSQSEGSILSSLKVADETCEISWDFTQNFTPI